METDKDIYYCWDSVYDDDDAWECLMVKIDNDWHVAQAYYNTEDLELIKDITQDIYPDKNVNLVNLTM